MKIIHFADAHLGPKPGPVAEGRNVRAGDTLRCFDELIARAAEAHPDLIVFAGDLFDAAKTWSARGLTEAQDAIERIERLAALAPVAVLRGTPNHDSAEAFALLESWFRERGDVFILAEPGVSVISTPAGKVSLCALPGFDRGLWRAAHPGVDREEESHAFTAALEDMILGMRAQCNPAWPSVLAAHYTVEGANTESGQTMLYSQFEPVVSLRTLTAAGYSLGCFGHIHRPQRLGANAFYSGSINRLNFNDESQPRGFFIHTLTGSTLTGSVFVEMDSPRRFATVRLDAGAVRDFNLTGILPPVDVRNAVVRVLYSCAEEDHRALNRAAMERALTDAGAFWVQEIAPESVTASADRTGLAAESDPMENLAAWLDGRVAAGTITREEADAAAGKGAAIIARALADNRADRASGLFVPEEIHVVNYRNYRDETFDFNAVRFATVSGANGVGKSSLFMDAVYDALFEEPREGDLTGWIRSDPEVRSGAITLTFRVGDRRWRVSRTRVKSGKATLNLAEFADGDWQDRSAEKLRDTQAAIERVIGMNGQTLRACALIMQDQYGLFLQAGKEERMQILSDILGLGVWDEMADAAAESAAEANRGLRLLQARKSDYELQRGDEAALRARLDETAQALAAGEETARGLEGELNDLSERLAQLNTTAEVYALYRRQIAELNADADRAQAQIDRAEADRKGFAALLSTQEDILDAARRYEAAVSERDEMQERVNALTALHEKRAGAEAALRRSEEAKADALRRLDSLARRADELRRTTGRREELERQAAERERIRAEIGEAEAALARWNDADARAARLSVALTEIQAAVRADYRARQSEIDGLRRRVELLEDSGCPIAESATCRFLADAVAARETLPEKEAAHAEATGRAQAELEQQAAAVRAAEAMRDALPRPEGETLAALRGRLEALSGAAAGLAEVAAAESALSDIDAELGDLAAKGISLDAEIAAGREALAALDGELEASHALRARFEAALAEIARCRAQAELAPQLAGAKDRLAAAEERAAEGRARLESIRAEIRGRETLLEGDRAAGAEREAVREAIDGTKCRIADNARERDLLVGVKARLETELERADELSGKIAELNTQIAESARAAAAFDLLRQAFGPNGVPHSIMRGVIPVFEATASAILGQMTGGRMSVELVTEKALKSNQKKEVTTLDVVVDDADTGRLPYLSRSGGERVKACLSVILALSEIMKSKLGVQTGFLFIDEPAYLDGDGTQSYVSALETIQRRYAGARVLAISHDESFRARFPQAITVFRDEEGSHAVLE